MNDSLFIGLIGFVLYGFWSYVTYLLLLKLGTSYLGKGVAQNLEAMQLAVKSINVDSIVKVSSLCAELDSVKGDLARALEANVYDLTNATMLTADIEALEASNAVLKLDLASLNVDLERFKEESTKVASKVVTAEVATTTLDNKVELRAAVFELINQMGTPDNNYEIGVYNGVVSIANTVLEEDAFTMIKPAVEASKAGYVSYQMPKRDAKGRFLKLVQ